MNTVGKKDGITVETKSLGTAEDLEQNVLAAADGEVGASEVPNIFRLTQIQPIPWIRRTCS